MTKELNYRPDIDGLRAVAIISVLLFHADITVISGGFLGVDIFFVISGFLISQKIISKKRNGDFKASSFYLARLRRLFPAFFVTLLGTLSVASMLLNPGEFAQLGESSIYAIFSLSNVYFWMSSGYFDIASQYKPLLHTWSLSVEEQFYLFWPFLISVIFKVNARLLFPVFVLMLILSLVFSIHYYDVDSEAVFFLTPFRVFEFSIGALCVWGLRYRIPNPFVESMVFLTGLVMVIFAILYFDGKTNSLGHYALLPSVGSALLIYSGQVRSPVRRVLDNPLFIFVGLISYSLYLVHWPVFVLYKYWKFESVSSAEWVVLIIACFLLAYFMYKYIEAPFRRKGTGAVTSKMLTTSSAILCILFSVVSYSIWTGDGWPGRFENNIQKIYKMAEIGNAQRHNAIGGCHMENASMSYDEVKDILITNACLETIDASKDKMNYLVVGDSHAADLFITMVAAYPEHNFLQLTGNSCAVGKRGFPQRQARCNHLMDIFFKNDSLITGVDGVIMTSRWLEHAPDDLSSAIERVDQFNKPVYVFGPGIVFNEKVPDLLARSYDFRSKQFIPEKYIVQKSILVNEKVAKIVLENNAVFIDKQGILCPNHSCPGMINGNLIFIDTNHLSIEGGTYFGELLKSGDNLFSQSIRLN